MGAVTRCRRALAAAEALRWVALLSAIFQLACQGMGVRHEELPDDPIAIVYHTPEEARRRAENREQKQEGGPPSEEGVARVSAIGKYLSALAGRRKEEPKKYRGRMALLDPRTEEVSIIPWARRGAIPRAWSPDRGRLLFAQLAGEYLQLFELDLASEEVRTITRGPAIHPAGCYGPDGRFVYQSVTVRGANIVSRIMLTEPGGRSPRPVSEGSRNDSPTCAPDGSAIAWVSHPGENREVVMVRAPVVDGTPQRIAPGRDPRFGPDGSMVFTSRVKRKWGLWRIRSDGSGRTPIGPGTKGIERPAVSPDGRIVVYVADQGYHDKLFLRRMDGTGDRILLDDGDGGQPVW